jgi:hypothetical protein
MASPGTPASWGRDDDLDLGTASMLRRDGASAVQQGRAFSHAGKTVVIVAATRFVHVEAASVVVHTEPQLLSAAIERQGYPASPGMANRVVDRLLRDEENLLFECRVEPSQGASRNDIELDRRRGDRAFRRIAKG